MSYSIVKVRSLTASN